MDYPTLLDSGRAARSIMTLWSPPAAETDHNVMIGTARG
jgi:hypothetical protein